MALTPGSFTAAGTTIGISAAAPATQDQAGYSALTFTTIGNVEKIGTIGPTPAKVEFQPLNGPKQKLKGSTDYGSLQPSMAVDSSDAGQTLLQTASQSPSNYSFKVNLTNGGIRYFQGTVFGFPENIDAADSIVMVAPTVEINTVIVRV